MTGSLLDVVVIGAGLSGLVAGRRLAAGGASVRVLEARDRVGGRTLSVPLAGGLADLGGQWITPTQDRVAALADELAVERFAQYRDGTMLLVGRAPSGPAMNWLDRLPLVHHLELGHRIRQLDRLAGRISPEAPAAAAGAPGWDRMTLQQWLDARVRTGRARDMLTLLAHLHFAAEPAELSFLYVLHALRSTGGVVGTSAFADGEMRLAGGAQRLSIRLAEGLGDRVRLGRPVTGIEHGARALTVWCGPEAHRARFAVLALPPALADGIQVQPPFPAARASLQASMPLGPVIKCVLAYARPFWRERGLSGEAYSPAGPVRAVVDHTGPRGRSPALQAFVVAGQARRLSACTAEERRQEVTRALVAMFGDDAGQPVAYADENWPRDPWSAGCVSIMGPGTLTRCHHALRAPVGRIHFAGTETALRWPHYLDGAVEAGERAAAEVLARLS